jgi:type I restriction enzyme S subunit
MPDNGLPEGWRPVRFGDVADIRRDMFDPTKSAGLPYVALEHIEQGNPRLNGSALSDLTLSTKTRFRAGDTLFGKLRPHLRKAVRVPFDGVCSTDILALYPKDGLRGEYLAQLTYAPGLQDYAITTSIGTKMPRTTWSALAAYRLALPPPDEQRRIAEVLDSIDAAIEKTEAVIAATERLRSALVGELLTRGVPGWHTEWKQMPGIGTIPACWEVVRLGDVLSTVDYGTNVPASDAPGGIPILGMKNIGDGEVRDGELSRGVLPDNERTALLLQRGDILFNRTNSIELVGKVAIVREMKGDLSFASYLLRLRTDPRRAAPWWLIGFLNHRATQNALRRMATKGASQANINPTSLRSLTLPLPPIAEQTEVARLLEAVRARVIQEGDQLQTLGKLKGTTANALLSGRVKTRPPVEIAND